MFFLPGCHKVVKAGTGEMLGILLNCLKESHRSMLMTQHGSTYFVGTLAQSTVIGSETYALAGVALIPRRDFRALRSFGPPIQVQYSAVATPPEDDCDPLSSF